MNYYVYILTNKLNSTFYIGTTNDIQKKINEHKNKLIKGYTQKFNINRLILVESYATSSDALLRAQQLNSWSKEKIKNFILDINPKLEEIELI